MNPPAGAQRAYIGLGANLGDPAAALSAALVCIAALPRTRLAARSAFWRSAPVEATGPDFVNAVAAVDTALSPRELLEALLAIEHQAGRERPWRNAPRTLDLDLLMHGDAVLLQAHPVRPLELPHPRMHLRAFVLAPLAELAPTLQVPGHGPVQALLATCADQSLERLPAPQPA